MSAKMGGHATYFVAAGDIANAHSDRGGALACLALCCHGAGGRLLGASRRETRQRRLFSSVEVPSAVRPAINFDIRLPTRVWNDKPYEVGGSGCYARHATGG
jgi:hypothetical protein